RAPAPPRESAPPRAGAARGRPPRRRARGLPRVRRLQVASLCGLAAMRCRGSTSVAPKGGPMISLKSRRPNFALRAPCCRYIAQRRREMASASLAVVVVDGVLGAEHLAQATLARPAGDDQDLLRVRVLARLDLDQVRERQVAHGG